VEEIEMPQGHEGQVRADLDSMDRLWAVWQSDSLDKFVIQCCLRDGGKWGDIVHVAMDSAGSFTPSIAVDDNNVAWVVWSGGDLLGGCDIWSARWNGSGWEALGKVSESGGTGRVCFYAPVIGSVPGSGPLAVWWGGSYSARDTKDIYESKWTAYGWRNQACVSTPDSVFLALDEYPSLAVGSGGTAWVCWMKEQREYPYDTDIWCRYSSDVTPIYGVTDFRGEVRGSAVVLSWAVDYLGRFGVYRSSPLARKSVSDVRMMAVCCDSISSMLPEGLEYRDGGVKPGFGYQYWLLEERGEECYVYGPVYVEVEGFRGIWISAVYPNPFMLGGWILWDGPEDSSVQICDLEGRFVRSFTAQEGIPVSLSERVIYWDGKNSEGRLVASGVYIVRLTRGGEPVEGATRKVVVLR
jgi:hypothetical protein